MRKHIITDYKIIIFNNIFSAFSPQGLSYSTSQIFKILYSDHWIIPGDRAGPGQLLGKLRERGITWSGGGQGDQEICQRRGVENIPPMPIICVHVTTACSFPTLLISKQLSGFHRPCQDPSDGRWCSHQRLELMLSTMPRSLQEQEPWAVLPPGGAH